MSQAEQQRPAALEILVVEDSATQRELLQHMLSRHGYAVVTAQDGGEAIELLRTRMPATIISDIVMPGMDGFQLCRQIKADERLKEVPVILLTSLSDPQDVIQGLECGADNFVVKPYDEESLLTRLNYIITNSRLREPGRDDGTVEVFFGGRKFVIRSKPQQILDLLLSTYEAAVRKNDELIRTQNELKALNERLEEKVAHRTQKLEDSLRSVEGLCYTIAHDLRAPLRAMQGFSSALLDEYAKAFDETGQDYANRIVDAAKRMDCLIQDLLSYGRLSYAELPMTRVPLEEVVDSVLGQLDPEIRETQAQIEVRRPLAAVWANATVLEQVVQNLMTNALKFIEPGQAPQITICAEENSNSARLWIEDKGIGLEPAHRNRIFQVFERLHGVDAYPGTGIGLAIVQKGVERMGGAVGVESEAGRGSRFWIELQKPKKNSS